MIAIVFTSAAIKTQCCKDGTETTVKLSLDLSAYANYRVRSWRKSHDICCSFTWVNKLALPLRVPISTSALIRRDAIDCMSSLVFLAFFLYSCEAKILIKYFKLATGRGLEGLTSVLWYETIVISVATTGLLEAISGRHQLQYQGHALQAHQALRAASHLCFSICRQIKMRRG